MTVLPRHLLPQIPDDKTDEFVDFLRGNDVGVIFTRLETKDLKPIQSEYDPNKVKNIQSKPEAISKQIIVSQGGFILDGHHRWLARKEEGLTRTPVIQCYCSIKKLIELGHQFEHSFTKTVHEIFI